MDAPFWRGPRAKVDKRHIAFKNGLSDLKQRRLFAHDPHYFNLSSLRYRRRAKAPRPELWLEFLNQLWPDDRECRETLQEIFGLMITDDTSYQKIFMLVGPKRSGKGTIGRILTEMLGKENVAAPTLSSLTGEFGLQP